MKKSEALFGVVRVPTDVLATFAALLLSYRLREANMDLIPGIQLLETATTLPELDYYSSMFVLPSAVAIIIIAAFLRLYVLRSTWSAWNEFGRIIIMSFLWLVVVIGWFFLVKKQLFYSRVLLVHGAFFIVLFAAFGRASIAILQRSFLRLGYGVHQVVSIGKKELVKSAKRPLEHDHRYNYLGHYSDFTSLKKIISRKHVDLVLQTDPNPSEEDTSTLINYCRSQHLQYAFLPPVLADVPHMLHIEKLGLVPMVQFMPTPLDGWGKVFKRLVDLLISGVSIILLSPIFLIIAIAILFHDGWPIFYLSRRVGDQGRKRITMLKFRTMVRDADNQKKYLQTKSHRKDGPLFKIKDDPRVTPFGKFLRRWTFDEMPQLFNVFIGSMSLVGPRPHLPAEVDKYSPEQRRVFAVKPGMTGLSQVSGRSNLQFDEEVRLDLKYIEEWSVFLDLWILWRTIFTVLARRGAD